MATLLTIHKTAPNPQISQPVTVVIVIRRRHGEARGLTLGGLGFRAGFFEDREARASRFWAHGFGQRTALNQDCKSAVCSCVNRDFLIFFPE